MRQAEEGLSIDVQRGQIEAYGKINNLSVDVWVVDKGVSGSIDLSKRENGSRLLLEAKSGDVIVCSKLDRLFRNASNALTVLAELKSRGVALHVIDIGGCCESCIGELVFTILAAVSQQERSRIRERISEARAKMRLDGLYQGGRIAFGYKLENHKLVKDETQLQCLRMVQKKRSAGYSLRELSAYVEAEWGYKLSHNAIRTILKGERKFGSLIENC